MKLSAYPYVQVRIECTKCGRSGAYRLARLADKYGSEIEMLYLLGQLAADCPRRAEKRVNLYDRCEAFFPDLHTSQPPDLPKPPATPLKLVS